RAPSSSSPPATLPNPFLGNGTADDPYLVDWIPGELANPYNWPDGFKWYLTVLAAIVTLCSAFGSSVYAGAIEEIMKTLGASQELATAGISLYVLCFGGGTLLFAPLSEMIGRRMVFNITFPLFGAWSIGAALSPNIAALLVFRTLSGFFGSAPLTNGGGQVADVWQEKQRATAASLFALAPFLGPVLGPIVGGFVGENCGFRWVLWVQVIFIGVMIVLCVFMFPETYAPTLLRRKAAKLQALADQNKTGEVFISKFDKVHRTNKEIVMIGLARPFELLFKELIVAAFAGYCAIVYGTLYMFFTAFPIVFQDHRGWSQGVGGLAFCGVGVGLVIGALINPLGNKFYAKAALASAPHRPPPESRLPMCCLGAVLLPIGLFWFAWTSEPSVHWIVPIIASAPFGAGFLLIFTSMIMYLLDSYTLYGASALAANAVARSVLGAVFPLFAAYMYNNLGLEWAGTLVAFLSLVCTPIPFLFYYYGHILRRNSRYAPSEPVVKKASSIGDEEKGPNALGGTLKRIPTPLDEALNPGLQTGAGENRGVGRGRDVDIMLGRIITGKSLKGIKEEV
ncbi:hypothetical protein P7C73_g5250, partial [Tremellales sp. Uapishka_1]